MPLWLRKALTALSFAMFFGAGLVLGLVVLPLLWLVTWSPRRWRRLCTRFMGFILPSFCFWMRLVGLIDYERICVPEDLPTDRPYLLVANHPSIIDVVFCLGWFPGLTCVVKASYFRSPFMALMLRSLNYVAGPGLPGDDDPAAEIPPPLQRMIAQLEQGRPLVVFPEGTRSPPDSLLKFHRGPFEAAVRAGVPLLPLFIGVDNPGLTKGIPLTVRRMTYTFEWLPWVDCADEADPRKLRAAIYRGYRDRHAAHIAARDIARERGEPVGAEA